MIYGFALYVYQMQFWLSEIFWDLFYVIAMYACLIMIEMSYSIDYVIEYRLSWLFVADDRKLNFPELDV